MTRVGIVGAAGRMGQALIRCSRRCPGVRVAAAIERHGHPATGQDAGRIAGTDEIGVRIADSTENLAAADVVVDFTFHEAAPATAAAAAGLNKALVLGTTGLTAPEAEAVKAAAAVVPVVWAPNMSLGVNLLFALVEKAARTLGLDYDAEVVEVHHCHKKDAPSGTALHLAERIAAGRGQDLGAVANYGRRGIVGARPAGEIGIHSVRAGDVIGDHTVLLAAEGERVELTHRATSRDAFAMGALRAAAWAHGQTPGLYTMKHVLGL